MFEVHVRSDQGWLPVACTCAAARAMFPTLEVAQAAIDRHVTVCGAARGLDLEAHNFLRGYYRAFAVEAVPA